MATFGKTDVGGTSLYTSSVYANAMEFTMGSVGGTLSSISVYIIPAGVNVKAALYAASFGALLATEVAPVTSTGNGWVHIPMPATSLTANVNYCLAFKVDCSFQVVFKGDNTGNQKHERSGTTYAAAWVDPFGGSNDVWEFSIYATYTPSATLKTVTDSLGLSDTILRHKPEVAVIDSVGASDAVLGNKAPLIVDDAVSLADLVEIITGVIIKTVLDTIGLADQALVNKPVAVADTVNVLDAILRHRPSVAVADVIGAAEAVLVSKLLMVADYVSLIDVLKVLKTLNVSDEVSLVDAISTPSRVLRVLDGVGFADGSLVNKTLQVTENVSLVEVVEVGVGGVKKTRLFLILGDLAVQLTGD